MLLLGDAGIGKSRLTAELFVEASKDAVILTSQGYRFGQMASFGLWSQAFEGHLRRLPADEVAELCGGFLDDLAVLLRSVAAARGGLPDGEIPLFRLMDGLAVLVANLSVGAPVMIAFDDVHLADPSSWDTLEYLARSLPDYPVLVIASARPVELAGHPSAGPLVVALEQYGQLRRVAVPPLRRDALTQLCRDFLDGSASEALVDWVADRSGGNPFFALGLLGAVVDEDADLAAPRLRQIPEGLADRVAQRLVGLGPGPVGIVEALAVLERPVPLAELARTGDVALDTAAGTVAELIRSRLVTVVDNGSEALYALAHPLLQEVVYARIDPTRRRALHGLVARSLVRSGREGEAAPHFACSAEVGDDEVVGSLRDAVRQAEERGAHGEARAVLGIIVDLLPDEDQRWLAIADIVSPRAFVSTDHPADGGGSGPLRAMRLLDSLLERSADLARRAAVKYRLARLVGWGVGDPSEAILLARAARDLFADANDDRSAVVAAGGLAHLYGVAGEWAAMESEAVRALGGAEAIGEMQLASNALAALYRTAVLRGRFDEAIDLEGRLIALARTAGDRGRLVWTLTTLAVCRAFEGRMTEAVSVMSEARSLAPTAETAIFSAWDIGIGWLNGGIRGARNSAATFMGEPPDLFWHLAGAGFATMAAVEADDLDGARSCLTAAEQARSVRCWSYFGSFVDHAAAVVAWRSGQEREALAALGEAAAQLLGQEGPGFAALALVDQAELALDVAAPEIAREAADHLGQLARYIDRDLYRGYASFGRACAALARGASDLAGSTAGEAVEVASRLGYPLLQGRALVVAGRSGARSDRRGAAETLGHAAALFDSLGAVWRAERTRTLLRSLGSRGRRAAATGSGVEALTPREREVAGLAVAGRTARQIAEVLFVGERTVEGHLASVYAKLGISSKMDLARRAAEFGLSSTSAPPNP